MYNPVEEVITKIILRCYEEFVDIDDGLARCMVFEVSALTEGQFIKEVSKWLTFQSILIVKTYQLWV